MILFFFKSKKFNPLIFIIIKISSEQEMERIEAWTNEIFQILLDEDEATKENILIFSIIKDYDRKTINLVLPSTLSDTKLVDNCHNNTKLMNQIIVDTIRNMDSSFHIELLDTKVKIHHTRYNLSEFSKFYTI
jgi:hypothetical protein